MSERETMCVRETRCDGERQRVRGGMMSERDNVYECEKLGVRRERETENK